MTVHPKALREGFQVEVKDKLAYLIGREAFPQAKYSGGRMVAEVRYRRSPRLNSLAFLLSMTTKTKGERGSLVIQRHSGDMEHHKHISDRQCAGRQSTLMEPNPESADTSSP